jgi:hypothetical protein
MHPPTATADFLILLRRFNTQAAKFDAFSFYRKACAPGNGYTITFGNGWPPSAERRGADEEATTALICVLRTLVQSRDNISFHQIVEWHRQMPLSDRRKQVSAGTLAELDTYMASACSVQFHDWPITRKELFELFMYENYAHINGKALAKYERLRDDCHWVIFENDFEDILVTYVDYARWYKTFNKSILDSLNRRSRAPS